MNRMKRHRALPSIVSDNVGTITTLIFVQAVIFLNETAGQLGQTAGFRTQFHQRTCHSPIEHLIQSTAVALSSCLRFFDEESNGHQEAEALETAWNNGMVILSNEMDNFGKGYLTYQCKT